VIRPSPFVPDVARHGMHHRCKIRGSAHPSTVPSHHAKLHQTRVSKTPLRHRNQRSICRFIALVGVPVRLITSYPSSHPSTHLSPQILPQQFLRAELPLSNVNNSRTKMVSFRSMFNPSRRDGGHDFRESLLPRSRIHRDVHSAIPAKRCVCLHRCLLAKEG
jgi:hypothetical protein